MARASFSPAKPDLGIFSWKIHPLKLIHIRGILICRFFFGVVPLFPSHLSPQLAEWDDDPDIHSPATFRPIPQNFDTRLSNSCISSEISYFWNSWTNLSIWVSIPCWDFDRPTINPLNSPCSISFFDFLICLANASFLLIFIWKLGETFSSSKSATFLRFSIFLCFLQISEVDI